MDELIAKTDIALMQVIRDSGKAAEEIDPENDSDDEANLFSFIAREAERAMYFSTACYAHAPLPAAKFDLRIRRELVSLRTLWIASRAVERVPASADDAVLHRIVALEATAHRRVVEYLGELKIELAATQRDINATIRGVEKRACARWIETHPELARRSRFVHIFS